MGVKFYHCDPTVQGPPLCQLGEIAGKLAPKTIQVMGASAIDVVQGYRSSQMASQYDIFIVGEAPAAVEDKTSLPFQGEAGALLQDMLREAGLDFSRIYMTNLVKCRPPGGRDPASPEIKACVHHIYWEIQKYKPNVIILAGRVPLKLFNLHTKGGITKVRGSVFKKPLPIDPEGIEYTIVPIYHPAALLYNATASKRRRVIQDLRLAAKSLDGSLPPSKVYPCKYEVCHNATDVERMVSAVTNHGKLSFDTESPNLQLLYSPMILLQVSIGLGRNWVVPLYRHDPKAEGPFKLYPYLIKNKEALQHLRRLFTNPDIKLSAHNAGYDAMVVRRWLGVEIAGELHDSGCMHHLLDSDPPHNLETLADIELGVGPYDFPVKDIVGYSKKERASYDNIPDEILWRYGATDAECGYRLTELYGRRMAEKPHLMKLYREETMPSIRAMAETAWSGIKVDIDNLSKVEDYYIEKRDQVVAECRQLTRPDFNPGSIDQVVKHLTARGHAAKLKDIRKAKGVTADRNTLLDIEDPLAENVNKYRWISKRLNTYVRPIRDHIELDGRARYSLNLTGTASGRQSAKIVHQMPRISDDKESPVPLRAIFCEEDDYIILYIDFDQFELRIFSILSGESELTETLESGGDVHSLTAATAIGIDVKDVSEFNRSGVGKPIGFGSLYGSEGHKIATLNFENPANGRIEVIGPDRAELFLERFHSRYTGIKRFMRSSVEQALALDCTSRSVFGRDRHIPKLLASNEHVRKHAERECTNHQIQSPAASILTRTVCRVRDAVLTEGLSPQTDIRLLTCVHDSALWGVRRNLLEFTKPLVIEAAEVPVLELNNKVFPIAMGVGRSWADAEKDSKA